MSHHSHGATATPDHTGNGATFQRGSACPACGQLACLCRPNFFAGQLLTERELNHLMGYIRQKSRLHNKHLHGWGVVNGLWAACNPCDNVVSVSCGYALSPCGDDIVVCEDTTVDICKLIARCRELERGEVNCDPYWNRPECKGDKEEWILAIRYQDVPSRGVTPLRGGSCNSGCGCGGSTGCGCGGNGNGHAGGGCGCGNGTGPKTRREASPQCEPTRICEGFRFEVFRAPDEDPEGKDPGAHGNGKSNGLCSPFADEPSLSDRIDACYEEILAIFPKTPVSDDEDVVAILMVSGINFSKKKEQWHSWCVQLGRNLRNYVARQSGIPCGIKDAICNIQCPSSKQKDEPFNQHMGETVEQILTIMGVLIVSCLCRNIRMPCPDRALDERVPLAKVTVSTQDCRILEVCNWTRLRRNILTFPTLRYWLSDLYDSLGENFGEMCCDAIQEALKPQRTEEEPPNMGSGTINYLPAASYAYSSQLRMKTLISMAESSFARGPIPVDEELMGEVLLGTRRAEGAPLTADEKNNFHKFLLINRFVAPITRMVAGGGRLLAKKPDTAARAAEAPDVDVSALMERITKLEKKVSKFNKGTG